MSAGDMILSYFGPEEACFEWLLPALELLLLVLFSLPDFW
jgi:hypothetical protein